MILKRGIQMKKSSVFDTSAEALKQIISKRKTSASSVTNGAPRKGSQGESLEQKLSVTQTQLQHLQHDIIQLQAETDMSHRQVDQATERLRSAEDKRQQVDKQKVEIQQDLQQATIENINKLSQKISNKQNDILIGRQRISELKNTADNKERSVEDASQLQRLKEQQQSLEETQVGVQKRVDGANQVVQRKAEAVKKAKVAISNSSEQDVRAARERYQQRQIDLNTARYQLRGVERELSDIQEDLAEVQSQAGLLQGNVHEILHATQSKLAKDEQLLVIYQKRLATLQHANGRMQSLKATLRRVDEEVRRAKQEKSHLQQVLAEKINQLTNAKRKALDCQKQVEELQQQIQKTDYSDGRVLKNSKSKQLKQPSLQIENSQKQHPSLLKVAALTVSEILTRLDFGYHKGPKK